MGLAAVAFAAGEPAPPLSQADILAIALAENPSLAAARADWRAVQQQTRQAGALANPMVTIRGADAAEGGDWPHTNEKEFALEQPLTGFGKGRLQRRAAEQEALARGYEVAATALDLGLTVRKAYAELWAAQQTERVLEAELAVLARLAAVARTQYAAGQSSQTDVRKAQAESALLAPRRLAATAQIQARVGQLNALMGRAANEALSIAPLDAVAPPQANLENLFEQAAGQRPEIKRARAEVQRAEFERTRMGREGWPDYRVGVEYRTYRDDQPDMAMAMVSLDVPLWRGKVRAGRRGAEQRLGAAQAALAASRQQVEVEVQQAWSAAQAARESLAVVRGTLLSQAQGRLDASLADYRAGRTGFLDVLESERFLLEARLLAIEAERDVAVRAAQLGRALGADAPENLE